MRAVYKKELGQYFRSMIGYVYVTIFLFLSGYYFVVGNLLAGNGDIRNYFSSIITVVMFLLPMLTMRSFAEERKMRTEQLLMASPVSSAGIVIGKYLAVLSVFAFGLLFTLLYVLILMLFGQFDIWVILGNYVGMFVAASAFIAIGMLLSVLTENQMVAGVITYCTLLCLWLIGYAGTYLTSDFAKTLVSYLSLSNRFNEFAMGICSLSGMVYYSSIAGFFLFATTVLLEKRRMG
mgnify:CR=1 FL=1